MTTPPLTKNPWLRMRAMPRAIGVVCLFVGGVWFVQGIGVAKGSVMTGNALWAVLGAVVFVAGIVVVTRALNAAKAAIANDPVAPRPDEDVS